MVHLFFLCKLTDLENVSFDQKQPSEASLVSKNRDFEKKHVTTQERLKGGASESAKCLWCLNRTHTEKTFQIF